MEPGAVAVNERKQVGGIRLAEEAQAQRGLIGEQEGSSDMGVDMHEATHGATCEVMTVED